MSIGSARADKVPGLEIVVSDNSTDPAERAKVRRDCEDAGVSFIAPPEPVAMTAHWEWALSTALANHEATHVTLLTDRMLFKAGCLSAVWEMARDRPQRVLSYNHDAILDEGRPVKLIRSPGSGRVVSIDSRRLLELSALGHIHPAIPRMLNAVVPLSVVRRVRERFGGIFASISPDFCFGYRCLAVEDSIDFYDFSPLVHHASGSSNGRSYARGVVTDASLDFARELGPLNERRHEATPVPELRTLLNACLHEYCAVRSESRSAKFPPVDVQAYLAASARQIREMDDPEVRRRMLAVVRNHGLTPWAARRQRLRPLVTQYSLRRPRWLASRVAGALRRRARAVVPERYRRDRRLFATPTDALEYALASPAPREPDLTHLGRLVEG
jgi:hypothetical protein